MEENFSNAIDISLKDLACYEGLSSRSINICEDSNLISLERILGYYEQYKSFKFLRNCGAKTENELTELCRKYQDRKPIVDLNNTINKINTLTQIQKALLIEHTSCLIVNIGIRNQAIKDLSKFLNPEEIFKYIYIERYDFLYKNMDKKSISQIIRLKNDICSFVDLLKTFGDDQLNKECAKIKIKQIFNNPSSDFDKQIECAFDSTGKIKLFRLISLLLDSEQIFDKMDNLIFRILFNEENTTNETLETIEINYRIPRERIHKIKNKLKDECHNYFSFIKTILSAGIVDYGFDNTMSFQLINRFVTRKINKEEEVNFNATFYSIIFSIIYNKNYSIFGDDGSICIFSSNYTIHSVHDNSKTNVSTKLTEEQALDIIFNKKLLTNSERNWKHRYKEGKLSKEAIANILNVNQYIVVQPQLYAKLNDG